MLRQAGYYTAYKGKWHLSETPPEDTGDALEEYGFADWQAWGDVTGSPLDGHNYDAKIAAEAVQWLTQRAPEVGQTQPWYLAVNLMNPHDIMYFDTDAEGTVHQDGFVRLLPAPNTDLYNQEWDTALPANFEDDLHTHPEGVRQYLHYCDIVYGHIPHDRQDLWHNHVNYYVNCIRDVDRRLGEILDALEASGQAGSTIIIYTSDHGEMAGAHGLRQKGGVAFKEALNVPFIVVHPDGPRGSKAGAISSHLDLAPTLLALAGLPAGEINQRFPQLRGEDLSEIIFEPAAPGPRGSMSEPGKGALFTFDMLGLIDIDWVKQFGSAFVDMGSGKAETPEDGPEEKKRPLRRAIRFMRDFQAPDFKKRQMFRAVFDGRYKLVRYFSMDDYHLPETAEELGQRNDIGLYDLLLDPGEMNNLADPNDPNQDEALLTVMNRKLNALIQAEIGHDEALLSKPVMSLATSFLKKRLKWSSS
jgi:arylsulfatase